MKLNILSNPSSKEKQRKIINLVVNGKSTKPKTHVNSTEKLNKSSKQVDSNISNINSLLLNNTKQSKRVNLNLFELVSHQKVAMKQPLSPDSQRLNINGKTNGTKSHTNFLGSKPSLISYSHQSTNISNSRKSFPNDLKGMISSNIQKILDKHVTSKSNFHNFVSNINKKSENKEILKEKLSSTTVSTKNQSKVISIISIKQNKANNTNIPKSSNLQNLIQNKTKMNEKSQRDNICKEVNDHNLKNFKVNFIDNKNFSRNSPLLQKISAKTNFTNNQVITKKNKPISNGLSSHNDIHTTVSVSNTNSHIDTYNSKFKGISNIKLSSNLSNNLTSNNTKFNLYSTNQSIYNKSNCPSNVISHRNNSQSTNILSYNSKNMSRNNFFKQNKADEEKQLEENQSVIEPIEECLGLILNEHDITSKSIKLNNELNNQPDLDINSLNDSLNNSLMHIKPEEALIENTNQVNIFDQLTKKLIIEPNIKEKLIKSQVNPQKTHKSKFESTAENINHLNSMKIEGPEELHFISVQFFLGNKNLALKFEHLNKIVLDEVDKEFYDSDEFPDNII